MASTKLYLDKRSPRKDNSCPLKIAISSGGTGTRHIALDIYLHPDEWDNHRQRVIGRSDRQMLNTYIAQRKSEVDRVLLTMISDGTAATMTAAQLKERIAWTLLPTEQRPQDPSQCFCARFLHVANSHKGRTRESYIGTYKHIRRYIGAADDIPFAAITRDWLVGFDNYLAQTSPSRNARNVHLRNIRAVFNDAIDNDITTCYPFRRFHIKAQETAHRALTVDELRTLFTYPVEEWQQQYVDMFKLTFFLCGINIIDLFNLTEVVGGRVEYYRAKTHKLYSIKVEPEAQALIDRYRGTTHLLAVADRYSNHHNYAKRLNSTVQHIGTYTRQGRGGKKIYTPLFPAITTYWMRHTWATIAAALDIPVDTISRALGHSQTTGARVTSVYIAFDRAKIDAANRRVIDYVLYGKT